MREIGIKWTGMSFMATLPLPPISNHRLIPVVIKGKPRLIKSKVNDGYHTDLKKLRNPHKPFEKPCMIEIVFYRQRRSGDIDGRIKTLFDALKGIMFDDDVLIEEMRVWNKHDKDDPRVEVLCTEL